MSHYIELIQIPAMTFDPISKVKNVFYDEVNSQILVLKCGGSEVVVRGPENKLNVKVTVPHDKGVIQSIKFSPNQDILGVLRLNKNIDFVSFKGNEQPRVFSHVSKGKQQIEQFYWTEAYELVIITNSGFEYYQWLNEPFKLKLMKTHNIRVMRWFYYNCHQRVLIFPAPNPSSMTLHTFILKQGGQIVPLRDFEVDFLGQGSNQKFGGVTAGQISVVSLYGQLFLVIIKNHADGPDTGANLLLYRLEIGQSPSLTHKLKMDVSGTFALNTVDSLLVVHHQGSKISMLFDIYQQGQTTWGKQVIDPVVPPLPMSTPRPIGSGADLERFPVKEGFSDGVSKEMYSQNWITFPPNIVLDIKWGRYMEVSLKLDVICQVMFDKVKLIEFLLRRNSSQAIILSVISQCLTPGRQCSIVILARMLDRINEAYARFKGNLTTASSPFSDFPPNALSVLTQEEMYRQVFSTLEGSISEDYKFVVSVLMEYIRSLHQHDQLVEHYLFEMVLSSLVRQRAFGQLHQLLQYHVIADSKPIACVLLSFEREYRPALQLALDMFKRLSTADEEIIEVLLSHNQILPALRYIRSIGKTDVVSSRLFLDAAEKTKDKMLFHTVFKFFQERNLRLRKNPQFPADEHCGPYEDLYLELFPTNISSPTVYERTSSKQ